MGWICRSGSRETEGFIAQPSLALVLPLAMFSEAQGP